MKQRQNSESMNLNKTQFFLIPQGSGLAADSIHLIRFVVLLSSQYQHMCKVWSPQSMDQTRIRPVEKGHYNRLPPPQVQNL